MSTTKLIDNNRRTHAAKVLANASKKNQHSHDDVNESVSETSAFQKDMSGSHDGSNQIIRQYRIIREDVLKLREDLSQGYDLLKEWIDTKVSVKNILRLNR
jgi:hypothetical protein